MQSISDLYSIPFNPDESYSPQLLNDSDDDSTLVKYNHYNNPDANYSDSDSDYGNIYFTKRAKTEFEKTSEVTTKITEIKNKIFRIKKVQKVKKVKRVGRKRKGDHQNNDEKVHSKYDKDNIHRKIQINFIKFLFLLINEILINFGIKQKFLNIDYKNKKVVTKDNVENLKTTEIGQILRQDISTKYKKKFKIDKEINNKLYLKVIKNESIKNILAEKYINIFRNLYYKNKRNLNDYGLDIKLSDKVKTYKDFLDKYSEDSEYVKKIKNIVKYCYLPQKFVTNYIKP